MDYQPRWLRCSQTCLWWLERLKLAAITSYVIPLSIESNHTHLNFVLKYLVLLHYTIYFYLHFRGGQSMRPHRLRPQNEPFSHPLKQPITYGILCDFLMNHTISLTIGQSISVRCKRGFLCFCFILYHTFSWHLTANYSSFSQSRTASTTKWKLGSLQQVFTGQVHLLLPNKQQ